MFLKRLKNNNTIKMFIKFSIVIESIINRWVQNKLLFSSNTVQV